MTITTTTETAEQVFSEAAEQVAAPQQGPRSARARRRSFTAEYQRRIVAEYDAAPEGQKGAVLRREDLFHSHVIEWRAKIEAGTLGKMAPRKPRAKKTPEQARITELEKALRTAEAESERKDKVIADRDAALETMGKGVSFLEALARKEKP